MLVTVTFRETRHVAPAASAPAARPTDDDPATAVTTPPQVLLIPLGVVTSSPAGRLSLKAIPFSVALAFELAMLKVSATALLSATPAEPNDLVIAGGPATVRLAKAALPVPPFVEVTSVVELIKL